MREADAVPFPGMSHRDILPARISFLSVAWTASWRSSYVRGRCRDAPWSFHLLLRALVYPASPVLSKHERPRQSPCLVQIGLRRLKAGNRPTYLSGGSRARQVG